MAYSQFIRSIFGLGCGLVVGYFTDWGWWLTGSPQ